MVAVGQRWWRGRTGVIGGRTGVIGGRTGVIGGRTGDWG